MFTNPLSHAGYPPGVTGTPTTRPSEVRAATAAEVAAGVLTNCYVSPAQHRAPWLQLGIPTVSGLWINYTPSCACDYFRFLWRD